MDMKIFYFLAILGVTYGLSIPSAESHKSKKEVNIVPQLSAALKVDDHTTLLDLPWFKDAKEVLEKANFSNVDEVAKIPELTDVTLLPPLPDLEASIEHARTRVATLLGAAKAGVETAIQAAIIKAVHAADAVAAISEIVYNILRTYFDLAVKAPLGIATAAILEEGVLLATNSVEVVVQAVVGV